MRKQDKLMSRQRRKLHGVSMLDALLGIIDMELDQEARGLIYLALNSR